MLRADYIIDYHDIVNQSVSLVKSRLNKIEGIKIKECTILDLVFCEHEPIYTGNGVYFFKTDKTIVYVGSCSARNFVERIPAHFDLRSIGWFNSLLRVVAKNDNRFVDDLKQVETIGQNGKKQYKYTNDLLGKAGRIAFEDYSLVLINFKDQYTDALGVATITALESFLLASDILKPINKTKKDWVYQEDQTLDEILKDRIASNFDRLEKKRNANVEAKRKTVEEKLSIKKAKLDTKFKK